MSEARSGAFRAMGCTIAWWAPHEVGAGVAASFEEVEQVCSRFRPASEISLVDKAQDERVDISPLLAEVLRAADDAFALSGGLVDPTVGSAVVAAGYDATFELASRRRLSRADVTGWGEVTLSDHAIQRPRGVTIDLGGIAKGWAARRSLELTTGPALVDAAGDIAARGLWAVHVEHGGEVVADVVVEDGGVATSGTDRRRWADGHHIIDPRTAEPVISDVVDATVIADDLCAAETVAKCIVILGSWDGLAFAEAADGVRGALVTKEDGSTLALARTKEVLV